MHDFLLTVRLSAASARSILSVLCLLLMVSEAKAMGLQDPRASKKEEPSPVNVALTASLKVNLTHDAAGIFEYLSDAKKLTGWFPDQAVFEPQVGGRYHFRWRQFEGVWSGVVTEFIRGNTLGITWQPPGEPYETSVRFKLAPQGTETVLELTHSGLASEEALGKAVEAWRFYLQNLKSVIESGSDLRQQARQRPSRQPARARPRPPAD